MKKWSKYPITIRASIIGALITVIGAITIAIYSHPKRDSKNNDIIISNTRPINRDSIYIVEKVKSYYKLDSIKVKTLNRYDLDNNGSNNEIFIVYQLVNEEYTSFYDVFTIRDTSIHNLYHNEYYADLQDYDFFKVGNHTYFIKMWNEGSGAYLSLEIYKYSDPTRLTKIYSLPDTLDNLQGHYIHMNNKIFLVLAGKRYNLIIDSGGKVTLHPYTKRLDMADMQNSEHILRFDENNHNLIVSFDNKKITFKKSNSLLDTFVTKDTIILRINDICWIDDNSIIPTGLRYFQDPHFENNLELFDNFIAKMIGPFTILLANEGYGDWYVLNFKIIKNKKSLI